MKGDGLEASDDIKVTPIKLKFSKIDRLGLDDN